MVSAPWIFCLGEGEVGVSASISCTLTMDAPIEFDDARLVVFYAARVVSRLRQWKQTIRQFPFGTTPEI